MISKIVNFLWPRKKAKRAEKVIKEKQRCLEEFNEHSNGCKEELRQKLEEEINELPQNLEDLKRLLEREFERKKVIEDKAARFFVIISLIGVIFALFFKITETVGNLTLLIIFVFFFFLELLYLVSSVNSLFYVLAEINKVYEPASDSLEDLKISILLNIYQNLNRTNYLYTVYSNIRLSFGVLLIIYILYFANIIKCAYTR